MRIVIREPKITDIQELEVFFQRTVTHTFAQENIQDPASLAQEIQDKVQGLMAFLNGERQGCYFLACLNQRIIGTISYGPSNALIARHSGGTLKEVGEIGNVLVAPEYQNQGVGTLLLKAVYSYLDARGILDFCLDCGYAKAQSYWQHKLGEPSIFLKDYWGQGQHHLIWHCQVKGHYKEINNTRGRGN